MIGPLLRNSYSKIEWADANLNNLEIQFRDFLKRRPYRCETDLDEQAGRYSYKVKILEPLPDTFSHVIGAIVTSLCSSLDFAINDAVIKNGNRPTYNTGFPIARSRKKFKARIGKIDGASQQVVELVNRLEPYKGGNDAFWTLSRLSNVDKHSHIIPIFALNRGALLTSLPGLLPDGTEAVGFLRMSWSPIFPVDDGTILLTFPGEVEALRTLDQLKDHINLQFPLDIAFSQTGVVDGQPIFPTLRQLIDFVREVITTFDKTLSA